MADELLAGIAGATQGASSGIKAGQDFNTGEVKQAVGIQSIQNMQTGNAINQEHFKALKAQEADLNTPVYKKDVDAKVPKDNKDWFEKQTQGKWEASPNGEFMPKRKFSEFQSSVDGWANLDRLKMSNDYLAKENGNLDKNIKELSGKVQNAVQDLKMKTDKLRKNGESMKADKLLADAKKNMQDPETPEGQLWMPLQQAMKAKQGNQQKISANQMALTGADKHVEEVYKKYAGAISWDDAVEITVDPDGKGKKVFDKIRRFEAMKHPVKNSGAGGEKPSDVRGDLKTKTDAEAKILANPNAPEAEAYANAYNQLSKSDEYVKKTVTEKGKLWGTNETEKWVKQRKGTRAITPKEKPPLSSYER